MLCACEDEDMASNVLEVNGIDFIEYGASDASKLAALFDSLNMVKVAKHSTKNILLYQQHNIRFLLNQEPDSFAEKFYKEHGPSICSTAWQVPNAALAFEEAVKRGATPYKGPAQHLGNVEMPAIYGIGGSLIYFVDKGKDVFEAYQELNTEEKEAPATLLRIDHLTNNVPKGEMNKWCNFYEKIFDFEETRYFDIKGENTGLISKVMSSKNKSIIIPINEPTEEKSQIQEYLEEYNGSGIQHIALSTKDICATLRELRRNNLQFLSVPDTYYETLLQRVPDLEENMEELRDLNILADGDKEGYLLQIFTETVIGPIFYEIIQRKNHWGFGEGNFQALFDAIERDQKKRGYL